MLNNINLKKDSYEGKKSEIEKEKIFKNSIVDLDTDLDLIPKEFQMYINHEIFVCFNHSNLNFRNYFKLMFETIEEFDDIYENNNFKYI